MPLSLKNKSNSLAACRKMSGPPVQQVEAYRGVANKRDVDDDDISGETDNPLAVPALQTQLDEQKAENRSLKAQVSGVQQQLRDAQPAQKSKKSKKSKNSKRTLPPLHAADDNIAEARIAEGDTVIARLSTTIAVIRHVQSDEHQHLMTDSPPG